MFLGVNHRSERLLVRIGEERVESALAPPGVTRCGSENGRVFRGTIMVEPELYKGDDRLATWFNLAMAHNATMEAKEAQEKPRKKKRAMASSSAATKDDDDEEVLEASDSEDEAAPPTAPAPRPSTTGAQFARCVLHVIQNIPPGKVAAYGQVAALAGAPRNARQVGAMLRDGLCMGGARGTASSTRAGRSACPPTRAATVSANSSRPRASSSCAMPSRRGRSGRERRRSSPRKVYLRPQRSRSSCTHAARGC